MLISRNWLKTFFANDIPSAEKLAEIFTFHSFEVEGTEDIKDENGEITDYVLDVKVLPDRAHYALSHAGVAMEVSVLSKTDMKERKMPIPTETIQSKPEIHVENPDFCRRYTARVVENVSVEDSPKWLVERLKAIGQRSINTLVDLANYTMFDIGQPIHVFDADKVVGAISVRPAVEGERITLLDGREIILHETDSVIADEQGALVVAGAKGGKRAEVSGSTTRIIIESANFEPTAVRRTSTKHDIRSESSKRFENELTPELAIDGMHELSALICEQCPRAAFGPIVDEYPVKATETVIEFDPAYLEERLGVSVLANDVSDILRRLGITVQKTISNNQNADNDSTASKSGQINTNSTGEKWLLTIPFNRLDLTISEDIVEEIGRIYGYEHIEGTLPPSRGDTSGSTGDVPAVYFMAEKSKNVLAKNGFSEVSLYAMVSSGDVEIAKPLAKDKAFLRTNLTLGMTECLTRNVLNADILGLSVIKIFEVGHVFNGSVEETRLTIGVAQIKKDKKVKASDILNEVIKKLSDEIGVELKPVADKSTSSSSQNSLVATVEINLTASAADANYKSGTISDLHFEKSSPNHFQKISAFPFITRDIAVFVPESVAAADVEKSLEKGVAAAGCSSLLARKSLFDEFKKEGKVSYAFRLVFQSMERTLTDEEVNSIMEKVNTEVVGNGWEVR